MNCSMPGLPVLHYLPEFAQTHVHLVSDAIQPSHPPSPPSPLVLNLSQHQGLFVQSLKVYDQYGWLRSLTDTGTRFVENLKAYDHWVYFKWLPAAAAAKSLQSCPTLCDPTDGSPPGSTVPGILQARTLEWVAISFSNAWKWKVKVKSLSHVRLFATPWTAAHQAPLSMGFSRQQWWSGLPLPSPSDSLEQHN